MSEILNEVAYTLALLPPGLVMLGGGILLIRAAPRLGPRARWAGIALVALFAFRAATTLAVRGASVLEQRKRIGRETLDNLMYAQVAANAVGGALVCGLTVRAAARAQRLD